MEGFRLDLVIFGATGFTGKVAVYQVLKLKGVNKFTWGVSGRNATKLKEVLMEVSERTGENLDHVPIIVADIKDKRSIVEMASQAKVVVNCVGPYRFFGEPVVKACIEAGAHHVDVSGEPEYMERMQLEYNKSAQERGVYVISACGFDSLPADLGLAYFVDQFKGEVNSVEVYFESGTVDNEKIEGPVNNYATWESAVHGFTEAKNLKPLRKKLFQEQMPKLSPKLDPRSTIHKSEVINKWCLPFLGSDRPVMYRSQRFLYEHYKVRPVQVESYIAFSSLYSALMFTSFGATFSLLTKTNFTRNLLLKYPEFFSAGFVSRTGPTQKTMENATFTITFCGKGWTERKGVEVERTDPPNKTMITRISGRDPSYGFASMSVLLAAITIVEEKDKMPGIGGVLPPGAAFGKTSLMDKLLKNGLTLEVVKEDILTGDRKGEKEQPSDDRRITIKSQL